MKAARAAAPATATSDPDERELPNAGKLLPLRQISWMTLVRLSRKRSAKIAPHQIEQYWAKIMSFRADKVFLSNVKHRTLWVSVLLLQLSNASLLVAIAFVHLGYNHRDSCLWFIQNNFLFSDSAGFPQKNSMRVAMLCLAVSAVFVYRSVKMLSHSCRQRRFRFAMARVGIAPAQSSGKDRGGASSFTGTLTRATATCCNALVPQRYQTWPEEYRGTLSRLRAALSIEGRHFDLRFLCFDAIQIGCQTYSAYTSSATISNLHVNSSYGAVIFVNCLVYPLSHLWFGRDLAMQRFVCVLTDLLLTFVWGAILLLWMLLPSLQIYWDEELRSVALDFRENTTRQVEHVLVVSLVNLVCTLLLHVSSIMSLTELKIVLTAADRDVSDDKCKSKLISAWRALSVCYGIALLVIYICARSAFHARSSIACTCIHEVHPWFTTKRASIGRKFDCVELGITGRKSELAELMAGFEESSLANLQIANCTFLEIPNTIRDFPQLITLTAQNSTLYEWDSDAAVSKLSNPSLRTTKLLDVDLKSVPLGLVAEPLPPTMEVMVLRNLNATTFVDLVGNNWQFVKIFNCDRCGLTAVPAVLQTMSHLTVLVLRDNLVENVADGALESARESLRGLFFDGNLLSSLSPAVRELTAKCDLSIQRTCVSISSATLLQTASSKAQIYGYGSPACNSSAESISSFPQLRCFEISF